MPPSRHPPVAGRWVLHEELGRGATGTVRRARDLRTGTDVAAKVLHDPADPAARAAWERERSLRLDHPHVLTATAWAADGDTVLITMPLARGGSLRDRLTTGPPHPGPATRLVAQLLDALAAVHAAGVVHGDVKPANVLLRDDHHLLLADFGVATRVVERLVAVGTVGTPAYLPPERRSGGTPHPSQDVYAAGVLARLLLPRGPLVTLWDSMTRREPQLRPSASGARRRLRELSGSR